jgi:formylglycine-generating enzyme required for sulfatase activity
MSGRKVLAAMAVIAAVLLGGIGAIVYSFHRQAADLQRREAALPAERDGMVLVARGKFYFGEDRQPAVLPAYYIDRKAVAGANFWEARDACTAQGKRLPVPPEWEKAVRSGIVLTAGFNEWVDERITPGFETAARFHVPRTAAWYVAHGERALMFPADYRGPDVGYRCVLPVTLPAPAGR